jgi:hypothetical protein
MKKLLFIGVIIAGALIFSNCNKNDDSSSQNNNNTSLTSGTYNASGTISFTAGGVNYSLPISIVIAGSKSLEIQTLSTDLLTKGITVISCSKATSAITTGTYTSANSTVTYTDAFNSYLATTTKSGSTSTINITTLTSTSIQGTFTATLVPNSSKSNFIITNGVINCTIGSKRSK